MLAVIRELRTRKRKILGHGEWHRRRRQQWERHRTEVFLEVPEQRFAKALAGAWYETTKLMSGPAGADTDKVLKEIAAGSEDTLESYKEQLSTTNLFYAPQAAADFTTNPEFKTKMNLVRQFCFNHALLGANTKSVDDVGIQFPDGSVQGSKDRITLRFNANYMQMAAQGKL